MRVVKKHFTVGEGSEDDDEQEDEEGRKQVLAGMP